MTDTVVVFDVGSTLIHPDPTVLAKLAGIRTSIDSQPRLMQSFAYALEADLRVLPEGDRAFQQGQEFFRLLADPSDHDSVSVRRAWLRIHGAGGCGSALYSLLDPDAVCVLTTLREHGCSVVAASNSDGTLRKELSQHGLDHFFDHILDSTDIGWEKPHPQFFEAVLAASCQGIGVSAWHVGNDLVRDVTAALLAGFRYGILYDRSNAYSRLLSKYRIHSLREVVPLIVNSRERHL